MSKAFPTVGNPATARLRMNASGEIEVDDGTAAKSKKKKSKGFQSMGLSRPVFGGVMRMGYKVPTPIQRKALPIALQGSDLVAMARTGSGKTAAFIIPMLERLKEHSSVGIRAIILSPTRELATQTLKFTKGLGKFTTLRFCLLVGGDSLEQQFAALANCPDVVIATPGRLMHQLMEVTDLSLRAVEYVVFDEADRLFEMGFAEQLRQILKRVPEQRQTLLFSATLPKMLVQFARAGLRDPALLRLDTDTKVSDQLALAFFTTTREQKPAALLYLLQEVIPHDQQSVIFAATRHHVEYVRELLAQNEIEVSYVYGAMDMTARKINLAKFRARKTMLLIVTDVAARGIDIPLLDNAINYDFPSKPKLFVHRVGRVARAGRSGVAFSLVSPDELPYMIDLNLFLGNSLSDKYKPTEQSPAAAAADSSADSKSQQNATAAAAAAAAATATAASDSGSDSDSDSDGESGALSAAAPIPSAAPTATASASAGAAGAGYSLSEMTARDVHFGRLPQSAMDLYLGRVGAQTEASQALWDARRHAVNAYQLYYKTRTDSSRRSVRRAKKMLLDGIAIHPLLLSKASAGEHGVNNYLDRLRNFRPAQTVFEVEAHKAGRRSLSRAGGGGVGVQASAAGGGAADNKTAKALAMMNKKRRLHQQSIAGKRQQRAEEKAEEEAEEGAEQQEDGPAAAEDVQRALAAVAAATVAASGGKKTVPRRKVAVPKRRLSKAERKRLKSGGGGAAAAAAAPTAPAPAASKAVRVGGGGSGSFRDETFFVSTDPSKQLQEEEGYSMVEGKHNKQVMLEEALLDLLPDDVREMNNKRRVMHWDTRKRKYVQTTVKELREAGIKQRRVNTGRVLNKDKHGEKYRQWSQRTHRSIGGDPDPSTVLRDSEAADADLTKGDWRGGKRRNADGTRGAWGTTIVADPAAVAAAKAAKAAGRNGGRKQKMEGQVKTAAEMKKARRAKEKNAFRQMSKTARRAANKAAGRAKAMKFRGAPTRSKVIMRRR